MYLWLHEQILKTLTDCSVKRFPCQSQGRVCVVPHFLNGFQSKRNGIGKALIL